LQLNGNRVEISMPFQLAIALILSIILLLLVVFKLGQISRTSVEPKPVGPTDTAGVTDIESKPEVTVSKTANKEERPVAKETGDNRFKYSVSRRYGAVRINDQFVVLALVDYGFSHRKRGSLVLQLLWQLVHALKPRGNFTPQLIQRLSRKIKCLQPMSLTIKDILGAYKGTKHASRKHCYY